MNAEPGVIKICDDGAIVGLEAVEVGLFEWSEEALCEIGLGCLVWWNLCHENFFDLPATVASFICAKTRFSQ